MITRTVAAAGSLILITLFSCNLEPCKDFTCVNGEAQEDYNNCICLCNSGWSGSDCTIEDKCVTGNIVCLNCPNHDCCDSEAGRCNCLTGYEGDSCQIFSRDRFLDNNGDSTLWKFNDTCGLQAFSDTVKIKANSSNTSLEIYNLRDIDANTFVKVNVNKLTFTMGSITAIIDADTISSLRGTLSQDMQLIRVTYRVNTGNCSGTWNRL